MENLMKTLLERESKEYLVEAVLDLLEENANLKRKNALTLSTLRDACGELERRIKN
jgi:hypothetical protein